MNNTIRTWIKDGLWMVLLVGVLAAVIRFTQGLGFTTGMNDSAPWGLWIAFKLVFVALAGGGFTLAGMVYIFHMEKYRPVLRRAILIALLGYGSFIVSLILDLGLPWHIYMPIINWQHHSVMFEIAWCVMLYFSVLVLEFSPVILEHPWFSHPVFRSIVQVLHRLTLPLIIAGIVLSTLHQSSLGSLFLIMPHRVHPLWYSPWIPYLFFTSAIAAGMMALVLEAFLVERWFKKETDYDLLLSLGRWSLLPLGIYLILRLVDQWNRGILPEALDGSWQSVLFLGEILLGGVLPILLLSLKKIQRTRQALLSSAVLLILGIVSQRMSLSMFTMLRAEGTGYSPALGELLIAIAIPAATVLIYLFFAENLQLYGSLQDKTSDGEGFFTPRPVPRQPGRLARMIRPVIARRSGIAVFVIAVALPVLSLNPKLPSTPVKAARGWETLRIDGNRSGYFVNFPHQDHQLRLVDETTGKNDCQQCHHLDFPEDDVTVCSECHADFYQPTSIFNHSLHQSALGGNAGCLECHPEDHVRQTAAICQDCHENMSAVAESDPFSMMAPSYQDAMHGCCLNCHEKESKASGKPELSLCTTCHTLFQEESNQAIASLTGK